MMHGRKNIKYRYLLDTVPVNRSTNTTARRKTQTALFCVLQAVSLIFLQRSLNGTSCILPTTPQMLML